MLALRTSILKLLGADADTITYALPYYMWFAAGAPAVALSFIHSNLLRAEGMAKESMFATVGGSVVNIILDPVLIFTLGLGAARRQSAACRCRWQMQADRELRSGQNLKPSPAYGAQIWGTTRRYRSFPPLSYCELAGTKRKKEPFPPAAAEKC